MYHHGHVRWLYVDQPGVWHGRDEQTGLALCGTNVPDTAEIVDSLPAPILDAAVADIFASRVCAACARVVKLHRG